MNIELIDWTRPAKGIIMGAVELNNRHFFRETPMHHEYDLFEKFPDGSSLWRACVLGQEATRRHLMELAAKSQNRFYALDIVNGKVLQHRLNLGGMGLAPPKKIDRRSRAVTA
ncbi:MAG: hypothetical protein ACRD4Y_08125 [Candidatus Acidiferrales bacterium]